jgi:arylsulfotransferase ASST/fibronectin type III domain protein
MNVTRTCVTGMAALAVLLAACSDDNGTNAPATLPKVSNLTATSNSNNVLSAILTLEPANVDSARVVYWTGSEAKQYSPFVSDTGTSRMVVLGLRPGTQYNFAVEAVNSHAQSTSDTVTFATDSLPSFLAASSFAGATPRAGGYVLTTMFDGSAAYAVAFDSVGQVAWYRAFPGTIPIEEVKQQTNGDITAVLTASHGGELVQGQAVAVAPDGTILRTYTAPDSSYLDGHEFWELTDAQGAYAGALFLAYTARHLDLSAHGGPADSLLTGHQLIRQDASGTKSVVFDAWDHFAISDNVEPTAAQLDFDHPNSISLAPDGNYVVSWRNLDVITKIDASTGALIWTLAGPFATIPSDFTITGDPLNGFSAQHSVRSLDNGNLLIFDNGTRHSTPASRAVEYQLDESAHTATKVFEFAHAPPYYTAFTGSVQRLASGNTFIGWTFGNPLVATEVSSSGATVWEGTLNAPSPQIPYRFTKITSLYGYVRP